MKAPKLLCASATALLLAMGPGHAQTPLRDVAHVRDGIIWVGMAYEISDKCDDLRARLFRGLGYLNSLKRHAERLGYSDAEIEAYIDDRVEKARLEDIVRANLAALGVVEGVQETYCTVGQAQIDAKTRVGWLLR